VSEHFNIIGWLGKRPAPRQKRALLEFAFRQFREALGVPSQILLLDTQDQVEHQEAWAIDSSTLDKALRPNELLFVYGRLEGRKGDQPSISIDEFAGRASISISMPSHTIGQSSIGVDDMCRELCFELRKQSFDSVVLGGWEIDLPSDVKSARQVVQRALTETPAAEWLAIPTRRSRPIPGFKQLMEKDGIAVLRRSDTSIGH
jgi:hypothetical protein